MRTGYWRDAGLWLVVTALLGAALVGGVGRAAKRYFHGAVESVVGAPGEYDAIVHFRWDNSDEALQALERRLEQAAPGFALKTGPEISGRANVLIGFPKEAQDRALFESLPAALASVPGFDGVTIMLEPSVQLKDVHPELADGLLEEAERLPWVRFAFRHGNSVWAALYRPEGAAPTREALASILEAMAIVDVRFPDGETIDPNAAEKLMAAVSVALPNGEARLLRVDGEAGGSRETQAVRELLSALSGVEGEALKRRLDEAAAMVEALNSAAADSVGAEVEAALATFDAALDQIAAMQIRVEALAEQLRGAAAQDEATDILVVMLLQRLLEQIGIGERPELPEPAVDVDALKAGLQAIADNFHQLEAIELSDIAQGLRELQRSLPTMDPETLEAIESALVQAEAASGGAGGRLEAAVQGEWDEAAIKAAVRDELGGDVETYVRPGGAIELDARMSLMQLLGRAEQVAIALSALLYLVALFFADGATLVSYLRLRRSSSAKATIWTHQGVHFVAGLWGAFMMLVTAGLAGGGLDWKSGALVGCLGFASAFALAIGSPRISPVELESIEAALSLGMSDADTVREVVIPGGRPGPLAWLNRFWRRIEGRRNVAASLSAR